MKQWTFLFACLLSLFCSAYAQDLEPTLDAWLTAKYPAEGPGAAALVARGGEVLYHKAFGMANLELDVPMRTDMVFRIASISKQFTAICILMLAERGQLSLDDDLIEYLPDYPTEGQHISLRHLLTHTSGISRSFTLNPWDANIRRHDFSPKEFIDYFKIEPKSFAPGEYYQYNNFGYFLLGHIVELVSGMSYGDFVAQNIFEPLGMTNSYEAHDTDLVKNRAYGYEFYGTYENKTYVSPSQALGAGSLMSTVEDLHRWYRGLLSGKLVSQESLDLAFTNHIRNDGEKINYGFGWFINEINGSPTVEHAGGDHGFRVDALYLPDEEVFVAVFSNCSCGEPRPLSTKIAALAIGKPYTEPTLVAAQAEEIGRWVGKYTFADGSSRRVTLKDDQLYWALPNGTERAMGPLSNHQFVLENTFTHIDFRMENDSLIYVEVKNRISLKTSTKPYTPRYEIGLPETDLTKFVGRYQLFPEFHITIALDQGQLTAAGTGQDPLPIFPESPTRFFFKALDSHIDFLLDDMGDSVALEITQDGATYPGTRAEQGDKE